MSKKQSITIAIVVAVGVIGCVGLGLLRWGEAIYWLSDGERGWSLGASAYQTLGWGADAYRSDFGLDDEDDVSDCETVEDSTEHHRFWGLGAKRSIGRHRDRGGHIFFAGGMGCLAFWALLIGVGAVVYRHYRKTHPPAPTPEE